MGPVTLKELDYGADFENYLKFGFLPEVLSQKKISEKKEILLSYCSSYLKEEVMAEALTKSLEAFSRFLMEVTEHVGRFFDYTKIAKKIKISRHTCPNYFEILEDTLLGYRVFPHSDLVRVADLVKHPKFYFFDVGVYNGLVRNFDLSPERRGLLAEQVVFSQLLHSANALGKICDISSFRTRGGLEVDFIVKLENAHFAIEVKHSDQVTESDMRGLSEIRNYLNPCTKFLVHFGKKEMKIKNIWALPLNIGLQEMGL